MAGPAETPRPRQLQAQPTAQASAKQSQYLRAELEEPKEHPASPQIAKAANGGEAVSVAAVIGVPNATVSSSAYGGGGGGSGANSQGNGGNGGYAIAQAAGVASQAATVSVVAQGANGGDSESYGGNGGDGGHATAQAVGVASQAATVSAVAQGGNGGNGTVNGGNGGSVSFSNGGLGPAVFGVSTTGGAVTVSATGIGGNGGSGGSGGGVFDGDGASISLVSNGGASDAIGGATTGTLNVTQTAIGGNAGIGGEGGAGGNASSTLIGANRYSALSYNLSAYATGGAGGGSVYEPPGPRRVGRRRGKRDKLC